MRYEDRMGLMRPLLVASEYVHTLFVFAVYATLAYGGVAIINSLLDESPVFRLIAGIALGGPSRSAF